MPLFRQSRYRHVLVACPLLLLLLTTACKNNRPESVRLVSGNKTFSLPDHYRAQSGTDDYVVFGFRYPSMEPTPPDDAPLDDQVDIYLSRVKRPDRTTSLFNQEWQQQYIDQYDPMHPGQEYGGARHGPYQIYFSGAPEDIKKTIYLFYAADKQLVRAEIPGDWAFMSKAFRSIDQDFDLRYTFAKPIRTDLVQLDKDISDFLKQHIHTTP